MNSKIVFTIIQITCLLEIIVNFFTIEKIDITVYSKPEEVALRYIQSSEFYIDLFSVVPINILDPNLIWLRLLRSKKFSKYADFHASYS